MKPIAWSAEKMHTYPYGGMPPMHDPVAPPAAASSPSGPQPAYAPPPASWRSGLVAALVLFAFAIFGISSYQLYSSHGSASPGQVRTLQHQVSTLQGQVSALQKQHANDVGTISGLTAKVGTLTGKVGGMNATVNYMGQFKGSCIVTSQGQSGPFNAPVPCKTG